MRVTRTTRWTLVSGLLFVALYVIATIPNAQVGFLSATDEVAGFIESSAGRLQTSGYLGVLSAFFLLWFVGAVRSSLVSAQARAGVLTDTAFAGGVAASVVVASFLTGVRALAQRAGSDVPIGPDAMTGLYHSAMQLSSLALPVTLAVFVGGAGVALSMTRLLPRWFGWLSAVVALALLLPEAQMFMPVGLLWIVVVSVWLLATAGRMAVEATPEPIS